MGSSTGNSTKYYYIALAHPGSALTPTQMLSHAGARQIEIYLCPSVSFEEEGVLIFLSALPSPAQPSPAQQLDISMWVRPSAKG
jgi:hypothetical protein